MNLWVLIGICVVLGLLLFGKNPVREFQNNQKVIMEKYGDDLLTVQTNMYIEQKQKQKDGNAGLLGSMTGAASPAKPTGDQSGSDMKAAMRSSAVVVGNDPKFRAKGVYVAPANPDIEGNGFSDLVIQQPGASRTEGVAGGTELPTKDMSGYYPPIATQEIAPASDNRASVLTGREPKLRSGQAIGYEGSSVYAIDPQGGKTPLPDGDYVLQDGTTISISGGSRKYRN